MLALFITISFISLLLLIFFYSRTKKLAKYSVMLEDKMFSFVKQMNSDNEEYKKEQLELMIKSDLYKYLRWQNADDNEKLLIQHEYNEFYQNNEDYYSKIGT